MARCHQQQFCATSRVALRVLLITTAAFLLCWVHPVTSSRTYATSSIPSPLISHSQPLGGSSAAQAQFRDAKADFLKQYGRQYGYNGWIDRNWQQEVGQRLGPQLHHYLDYTGAALYTQSHIRAASRFLEQHTLSNPHSRNPSSLAAEEQLQAARRQVLSFFNADEEEYTVVWTSGATAGLKLVGELFPWSSRPNEPPSPRQTPPGGFSDTKVGVATPCGAADADANSPAPQASHFVYLRSNHKSVLGIGGYARARGAILSCVDEQGMTDWLDSASPSQHSSSSLQQDFRQLPVNPSSATAVSQSTGADTKQQGDPQAGAAQQPQRTVPASLTQQSADSVTFSLVAFPSKCNYEGTLYPLDWIAKVHAKSSDSHRWMVVVDAAAHVPTHPLDLSKVHPDFVPVSWYKVFGFPTGLGALIARKQSLTLLHKVYFGGGSVEDSTAEDVWRVLMPPPDGYEDGTQSFLSIAQLQFGFAQLQELGGIQAVEQHVRSLQSWMYDSLTNLKHANGQPVVKLFGHHHTRDFTRQSCIFQFLMLKPDGVVVSSTLIEDLAAEHGIGIRTGCMCNPSQCLYDLGMTPEERRESVLNHTDISSGFLTVWRPAPDGSPGLVPVQLPTGSVRVSLGYLSTFEDVYAMVHFLHKHFRDAPSSSSRAAAGNGINTVWIDGGGRHFETRRAAL